MTPYEVDPALEDRTFVHVSTLPVDYGRPSIRHDGRILAMGTDEGAVLWDLARGTELAFLPIGNAGHLMFEPSGDLITNGPAGVLRWPIGLGSNDGEPCIGPQRRLRLPSSAMAIAEDRLGRILALARGPMAHVLTPERAFSIGPLDDCRGVVVSPDGQWLTTGGHHGGAHVWSLRNARRVAELSGSDIATVAFSSDASTGSVEQTVVITNLAMGGLAAAGGSGGSGIGGGRYVSDGATVTPKKTTVAGNFASTSNNNVFGTVITI